MRHDQFAKRDLRRPKRDSERHHPHCPHELDMCPWNQGDLGRVMLETISPDAQSVNANRKTAKRGPIVTLAVPWHVLAIQRPGVTRREATV